MMWGEVVHHAVCLLNRILTKGVKGMAPYEGWKGKKLEHLKVFGCIGHVKKPANHSTKLSDRSTMMVHLGTEPGSKENRVVVTRDVFEEKKKWDWFVA